MSAIVAFALIAAVIACPRAGAEDGYDLWMRYIPVEGARLREYRSAVSELLVDGGASSTLRAARAEIVRGLTGMLGAAPLQADRVTADGAILVGTAASSPVIRRMRLDLDRLVAAGADITAPGNGEPMSLIAMAQGNPEVQAALRRHGARE